MGTRPPILESDTINRSMRHAEWFSRKSTEPILRRAELSGNTGVGGRSFGQAEVNCCLRGGDSKWGRWNGKDAAVLRFLIDPRQQRDFHLVEIISTFRFSDSDPRKRTDGTAPCSGPEIIEPPSPLNTLHGSVIRRHVVSDVAGQPQIEALGIGFSGVGAKKATEHDEDHYWLFTSHWRDNETGKYDSVSWDWRAVSRNVRVLEDIGKLHGGVVIQHQQKPFFITCSIKGQLRTTAKATRFVRFGSEYDGPYFTIVTPPDSVEDLTASVRGLDDAIMESMRVTPSGKCLLDNRILYREFSLI
jgi:hypothetical protein